MAGMIAPRHNSSQVSDPDPSRRRGKFAFFVGTFMFAIPLVRGSERLRRPVALIVIGALFVLAEILTARVLGSQIGNVVVLFGSAEAAWLIARDQTDGSGLISRSAIT